MSADLQAQVKHCLGHLTQNEENETSKEDDEGDLYHFDTRHANGGNKGERPLYRNRIEAIRAVIDHVDRC